MIKLSKILVPSVVGIAVYIIINKIFPEKDIENIEKTIRGGGEGEVWFKALIKKIITDKALKIALCSVFATAGIQHFQSEIEALLVDEIFQKICVKEVDGQLKIVCDIIKDHELDLHSKSMRELIVSESISRDDKIKLLKIKLDYIINGECAGKKRFFIVFILAILITVTISGVGGLALFLEALYRLFQEGKISRALYEAIIKSLKKKVPVEHLL
jgi:hypothetical protein